MSPTVIAANWKMNTRSSEMQSYFASFLAECSRDAGQHLQVKVVFALPFTHLAEGVKLLSPLGFQVFAQNLHSEPQGAFTGEISAAMLKDLGVQGALIGHSERRRLFSETDEGVLKKTLSCLEAGLTPLVCIGETLEERNANQTEQVLSTQTQLVLDRIPNLQSLIFAYEPVWAIGTGVTATPAQAREAHAFLRKRLASTKEGAMPPLLYGGSMNLKNAKELLSEPHVNGGLIGGASLNPKEFAQMVNTAIAMSEG